MNAKSLAIPRAGVRALGATLLLVSTLAALQLSAQPATAGRRPVGCVDYRGGELGTESALLKTMVKEVIEDRRYEGDDKGPEWDALREAHSVLRGNNHGGKRLIKAVAALKAVLPKELALAIAVDQMIENLEAHAGDRIEDIANALEDLPDVRAARKASNLRRKARKALSEFADLPTGVEAKPTRRMKNVVTAIDSLVKACRMVEKVRSQPLPPGFPRDLEHGNYQLLWSLSSGDYQVKKTLIGRVRLENLKEFADQVHGAFESIESGFVGGDNGCSVDTRYEHATRQGFQLRQTITCRTSKGIKQIWNFKFTVEKIE